MSEKQYHAALVGLGSELAHGVLYEVDEERDPRNLRVVFPLLGDMLSTFPDQARRPEFAVSLIVELEQRKLEARGSHRGFLELDHGFL